MAINKKSLAFGQSLQSEVDKFWSPENGRYCIGWSHEETNLMHRISEIAHDVLKMDVYEDLAGNRYLIKEIFAHKFEKVRMAGSHVDAVANGGRYDGPAGVIAPLVALYQMQQDGIKSHQSVVIPIWRNEESPWVNQFGVGSKLATGQLSAEFLRTAKHTEFSHNTLSWQMQNVLGLDSRSLLKRMESDNPALFDVSKVECAIETHIEQGSILENNDKSIGIVSSIRGNLRFPDKIEFSGVAGHSGTVPQSERKDALRAMGLMIANIDGRLSQIKNSGRDIVWSFPQGGDDMGHPTTICEKAWLRPEVRSTDINVLERCKSHFEDAARHASERTGVAIKLGRMLVQSPVTMSEHLNLELFQFAKPSRIRAMEIVSGAGHDVQVLAQAGIKTGLIFIRHGNNGASHRPDEIMGRDLNDNPYRVGGDFAKAAQINMKFLLGKMTINPQPVNFSAGFSTDLQNRGAKHIFAAR